MHPQQAETRGEAERLLKLAMEGYGATQGAALLHRPHPRGISRHAASLASLARMQCDAMRGKAFGRVWSMCWGCTRRARAGLSCIWEGSVLES